MSYVEVKQINHIQQDADAYVLEVDENMKPVNQTSRGLLRKIESVQKIHLNKTHLDIADHDTFKIDNGKILFLVNSPVWINGFHNESKLVYLTYLNVLNQAKNMGIHTIAFPLLANNSLGFPLHGLVSRAFKACNDFMQEYPDYPMIIYFGIKDEGIYKIAIKQLEELNIPQRRASKLDETEIYLLKQINQEDLQECIDSLCHRFGKGKGCFALLPTTVDYDTISKGVMNQKVPSEMNVREIQAVLQSIQKDHLVEKMIENHYLLKLLLRLDDLLQYLES